MKNFQSLAFVSIQLLKSGEPEVDCSAWTAETDNSLSSPTLINETRLSEFLSP